MQVLCTSQTTAPRLIFSASRGFHIWSAAALVLTVPSPLARTALFHCQPSSRKGNMWSWLQISVHDGMGTLWLALGQLGRNLQKVSLPHALFRLAHFRPSRGGFAGDLCRALLCFWARRLSSAWPHAREFLPFLRPVKGRPHIQPLRR